MKKPIKIAVTGAAGNIAYSLLFRLASGDLFGKNQPISLSLLEVPGIVNKVSGVEMELQDCAFETLHKIEVSSNPMVGFRDADIIFLVGAKPRSKGMERNDLILDNSKIFQAQGKAIDKVASKKVRVLVVGNPANTNTLIAMANSKRLKATNYSSMMRLDQNRSYSVLAEKLKCPVSDFSKVVVWGNHSATQFPDISYGYYKKKPLSKLLTSRWVTGTFIPKIQQRGASIINARGASSAASAASAAIDHMKSWISGDKDWVSMGILSDKNPYDIASGLYFSFPIKASRTEIKIVKNLSLNPQQRARLKATEKELIEERDIVKNLIP